MASISNRVSEGCLEGLPSMESSIVRVFSSSTFTDMTEERNYLMKKSIPKIRDYCFMKGLTFQLVDMRWGVRDEASIDHTTNEVVLDEVEKSKRISRGPYMLAHLGDKYGSRPMPSKIDAGEYKLIRRTAMKLGYDITLMDQWFKRDDNAEPAIFYLIPITKILPNYDNDLEGFEQQRQSDRDKWSSVDDRLTKMLRGAASQAYEEGLINKDTRQKYFQSVTEVEIQSGILEPESVKDKVICYCRTFLDLNIEDKLAWRFTDLIDGAIDDEAMELRERLKYTQVTPKLGPEEMKKYSLYWTPKGVDTSNADHMNYLNDMCEDFENKMTRMIEKALKKKDSKHFGINEKIYVEILQHLHFAHHKSRVFCGRADLLETVRQKMMKTHTVTDVEGQNEENESKDTDEMDTSSVASLYQSLDGQISKKDVEELKQIQEEHQGIKERLKQLGIIYNHADLDLDHENDPSRNPKAELIRLPAMKTYCRPVVIYGSSGSGKTSVMAKIAELSKTWFPNSVQIVRFLGTSANSSSIRDVLLGICLQIWVLYKVKPPLNLDLEGDFHFLTQYMLALLWRIKTKDRPLVILLDSVDQLQLTDHASTMHWLPLKVPPGVHIVVSAIPHRNDCLENLRSLLPPHDCMVHITSLSQETAENMIKNALKEKSRRLTKLQWRHLLDKTAKVGQPLYVKLLADQAVTWKSSTAMSKTAVGNSIKEAIVRLFESIEKEHGEIIITHLYGYLCAARDGLSLSELEDILSLDDEVLQDTFLYHLPPDPENIRFPSAVLTRALFSVLDYLVERRSGRTSVLSWYHRQFTEVATERYLAKDRAVKIHALLADFFQGVWYKKRKALKLYKKKTASYPNAVRSVPEQPTLYCHNMYNTRKLIELPYHLIKCQHYQVFRNIIACEFNFLYAKCKTLGVTEVIEDLHLCLVAMDTEGFLDEEIYDDIKFVHDVLLMGVNMIRKDTNNLPIQLMARLGGTVKTKWLKSLVKGAHEWCGTTSTPLLAPRSSCMPQPGGVLRITIDIEIFLTESSRERDLGHVMYLHEDGNHLFVLTPPTSRFDNAFIHMFDLADNGSRVFVTKLTRNFMAVNFLAGNKYMHVKDTRGYDQVFKSKSATPMELQHEAHCITASSSGKYLVYSSMLKVYVCLTDTRGGVSKIKHVLDTDQREKDDNNSDQDKVNEGSGNRFSKKKTYEVVNLIISPDEKFLAVFNNIYGYYKVWNLEKGEFLFDAKQPDTEEMVKFSFSFPEYNDIGNASIITDSNILIYRKDGYRFEGQLCMFDLEAGKFLHTLDSGSSYSLTLMSLHPTQRYLSAATSATVCSSGEHGKEWKIWDVSSGDMVTKATVPELFNDSWGMHCLELFGSDKIFAVSSHHGTNGAIHISYCGSVDAPNSSAIPFCSLNSHTMDVAQVLVSSDMKQLISASKDNCVKTWDLNKVLTKFDTTTEGCCDDTEIASKLIPMFEEELKQTLTTNALGVSSDAREIYLALSSGEMVIKDLKSNKVKSRVTMTSVPLSLLLVGSAGDLVVAASNKGNIEVWDIETKVIHKSVKCKHNVSCMAEASDVLVAGQAGMEAKGSVWNIRTGDLLRELSLLYSFYTVAINTSGTKFVSSMFDFPVVVSVKEDTESEMMDMAQVDTEMSAAKCTAVSPDESLALCGSISGSIRVIEMTGAYKFRLGQKSTVVTAVFSPDSRSIVSGGYKSIYIWNMLDGSLKFKVRKHDNFVLNIKFDHRGTHFLTTGRDKRIVIWDFRRGISLTTFYADSQVDQVEFTRRGYVVFVPEGGSSAATLKPNPVLKQMLKGKYNLNIGATITNAQGMALGFSSQKIKENHESGACNVL